MLDPAIATPDDIIRTLMGERPDLLSYTLAQDAAQVQAAADKMDAYGPLAHAATATMRCFADQLRAAAKMYGDELAALRRFDELPVGLGAVVLATACRLLSIPSSAVEAILDRRTDALTRSAVLARYAASRNGICQEMNQ